MCVESRRVRRGKPVRVSPSAEKSPGRTVSHRGTPYRCFLPDLTRFSVPAAQDPGSSQRAVKRGGIVTRTVPEPRGSGRTSTLAILGPMEKTDVIVIGAGPAGVTAAHTIGGLLDTIVLEARPDRIGGRVFSHPALPPATGGSCASWVAPAGLKP